MHSGLWPKGAHKEPFGATGGPLAAPAVLRDVSGTPVRATLAPKAFQNVKTKF